MSNQKKVEWNNSYKEGGDHLFYPHEEIVRFLNKYVRKKIGVNKYIDIMNPINGDFKNVKGLDIGCGLGRHAKCMSEFGIDAYGFDLSEVAIQQSKDWFNEIGKAELADNMRVASVTELPYEDEYFDLAVSHSVFDSMSMDIAFAGMKEVIRVLKKGAYMYLDLLVKEADEEMELTTPGQEGTVRTFFLEKDLNKLFGDNLEVIERKIIIWEDVDGNIIIKRNHFILKKK